MYPFRSARGPGLAANAMPAARAPNVPQPARAARRDWRGVFSDATIAGLQSSAASAAALDAVAPLSSPSGNSPVAPVRALF